MKHISRGLVALAGDGRTIEFRHWAKWLARVPSIRRDFIRWSEDFDPLRFNEAASVAVLANAASKAGYLAHTEYVAIKRHSTRGRPFRQGRCDLWIANVQEERSWAFEFKQHFCFANARAETLNAKLEIAVRDAVEVHSDEADLRVGCLVVGARDDVNCNERFTGHIDDIMAEMPLAFRINGGLGPVWLAFKAVG